MKILFLLDTNEFVEVEPTKLQLRQIAPGQSALGLEVTVPVRNEDGSPKVVDGQTQLQQAFRPLINYPVNLALPEAVAAEAPAESVATAAKAPKKSKKTSK